MIDRKVITHFHLACGLGGGAMGFNQGEARVGNLEAQFECIGGVDVDAAAIRDFTRNTGVQGTVLDLFDEPQYRAFWGKAPPRGWRPAIPEDLQRAAHFRRPNIGFTSMPCKGFSGLLPETLSLSPKYQALNGLTLRSMWLAMEAWKDDPVELIVFENVPRIANRGRQLLDRITQLLRHYGYAVNETKHDCGEIADPPLAQSRKRFLMVARHMEKVPQFLYEPEKHTLRAVGDVLGRMPLPGDPRGGPMHRLPALQWKTWVRLAFVEAGKDWRSLRNLRVVDGKLADYLLVPEMHRGTYGVTGWDEHAGTITGNGRPATGNFSVADPLVRGHERSVQLGVRRWDQPAGVVTGKMYVGGGPNAVQDIRLPTRNGRQNNVFRVVRWAEPSPTVTAGAHPTAGGAAIADPRMTWKSNAHENKMRVTKWAEPSRTVTGSDRVGSGALCVGDPRPPEGGFKGKGKYGVTPWDGAAGTVIGGSTTGQGAFAVEDPRPVGLDRNKGDHYLTGGHYGVVPWSEPAYVVAGTARHDNGFHNVGDPRVPEADERVVAVIRSIDGTWHRPFTTFELAGLQSLVEPEAQLELDGLSDSAWRERIGNAVPPKAAKAIAGVMGKTLLLAWSGQTQKIGGTAIWVRDVAVALSVRSAA